MARLNRREAKEASRHQRGLQINPEDITVSNWHTYLHTHHIYTGDLYLCLVPDGYKITRMCTTCTECTHSTPLHCSFPECGFLCQHMYICDDRCFDHNNGHICKHIHRVHSLQKQKTGSTDLGEDFYSEETVFYPQLEEREAPGYQCD